MKFGRNFFLLRNWLLTVLNLQLELVNLLVNSVFSLIYVRTLCSVPRLHVRFRNKVFFYGEELLAPLPTPKLVEIGWDGGD
jgi:hypothetical protein